MQKHSQGKKISRHISDDLEISSDDSDEKGSDKSGKFGGRKRINAYGRRYYTCESKTRELDEYGITFDLGRGLFLIEKTSIKITQEANMTSHCII